jgi:hypothetical protein
MGLFNLFGGKKKEQPKAGAAAPPPKAVEPAKVKAEAKAAVAAALAPIPAAAAAPGAEQVKLRLRLAAAKRAGQTSDAYKAAKALADIQAKAGRRLGARMWSAEADKILERDPEAA